MQASTRAPASTRVAFKLFDPFRQRIQSARHALLRHPWAARVLETRTDPTPAVIGYFDPNEVFDAVEDLP